MVVALAIGGGVFIVMKMDKTGRHGGGPREPYKYDSVDLPKTDPTLIHYKQAREIRTPLARLRAIAFDGELYVAGDKCVLQVRPDGTFAPAIGLDDEPRCLALANGRIYVGMRDHVEVISDGKVQARWQSLGPRADLTSIGISRDGRHVFVADRGDSYVVHYDGDGKLLGTIGRDVETGRPDRFLVQMITCFDLAVGADDLLRVADPEKHAIETYSFDGVLQTRWRKDDRGIEGFHGCCNPTDIALLAGGDIVTSEKGTGLPRVKVYDANGKFKSVVAGPDTFDDDNSLLDLATDSAGRIYVMDPSRKSVRVFEKK